MHLTFNIPQQLAAGPINIPKMVNGMQQHTVVGQENQSSGVVCFHIFMKLL